MIEVKGLCKLYGDFPAVWEVSFSVAKGEIVGLLGPNGAGKTTLMRILAGFTPSTFGEASINGFDVFNESLKARSSLGYLPESNPLYPELRVDEYLRYRARLKGVPARERSKAIDRILGMTYMSTRRRQLIETLSKGLRQRVGLADALINNPPLLILDEPTSGLDPIQQQEVRDLIRELGREKTVLLSTHILPEVERVTERVLIINAGQLVPPEWVESLRRRVALKAVVEGGDARSVTAVFEKALGAAAEINTEAHDKTVAVTFRPKQGDDLRRAVFNACVENHLTLLELSPVAMSLDEVFSELVLGTEIGRRSS